MHNYDLCVKRLYELNRFQQNRRAEMQFQLFQKEIQELTWTPEISAYSRKLAMNNVPLYLRIDKCLETKKKNIENIKKTMDLEKEMKEIGTFLQISLSYEGKFLVEGSIERKSNEFPKDESMVKKKSKEKLKKEEIERTWKKIQAKENEKNDYITKGQFNKLEKEIEDLTLKPKINKISIKIMEQVKNQITILSIVL